MKNLGVDLMKKLSKILSIMMVVVMMFAMVPSFAISSSAYYTSGDYKYELLDGTTAAITDYTGTVTTTAKHIKLKMA